MYKIFFKRILDLLLSLIGFIILFPIFLLVSASLLFANNGSIFFFQKRPGKNGRIFKIIKFKSMNDKKDEEGKLLSNELRLTKVGKFLRKTSLDEIPQLLNVIKGDMSLVGPRPLLVEYLMLYNDDQQKRHNIKPGVTGWAQVNGRNAISWKKKFEYDLWYVNNMSLFVDIKILIKTVFKVIKKEGVNSSKQIIVEKFNGSN